MNQESQPIVEKPSKETGLNWDHLNDNLFIHANNLGKLIGQDMHYSIPYLVYQENRNAELIALSYAASTMESEKESEEESTGGVWEQGNLTPFSKYYQRKEKESKRKATANQYRLQSFFSVKDVIPNDDFQERYQTIETAYTALCAAAFEGEDVDIESKIFLQAMFFNLVDYYIQLHAKVRGEKANTSE